MDLQIIAGAGRTGKTTFLQQEIIRTTLEEPEQRIIYIVPEQATLMVQKQLLARHPRHGILHVEILSFARLAYRVLQEAGLDHYETLDDMGKSMLLYKTALDHQDELLYYGGSIRRPGFIGQLKIMMTEIYQYRLDDGLFDRILGALEPESTLYRKIHDIRILYRAFAEKTAGGTIPTERLLDLLAQVVPGSALLDGADIFMDDFFGFTPQQYAVLEALWKKARHVRLTLPIDAETFAAHNRGSIYFQSLKILDRLQKMGFHYDVHWMQEARGEQELIDLADGMFRPDAGGKEPAESKHIRLYRADRPETEVEWVLSQIMQAVQQEGMRFSDTAILTGAEETYQPLLERFGRRYHIPVFIDRRARLTDHPAVQMITDMLRMIRHRYTYDTAFAWIKSGFLPFAPEELDAMENEALKFGWRGAARYEEGLVELCAEEPEKEALIRRVFAALEALGQAEASADAYTEALLQVMEALSVEEQLAVRAAWLKEQEQPLMAGFYEQTYDAVRTVLEQMHAVLGKETVTIHEYAEILNIGLSQSRVGLLPPVADQVQVADLGRSRITAVKKLYVIGFQDGSFPANVEDPGLLTDAERKKLSIYQDVAADRTMRMEEQEFFLYNSLGKAAETVCFTWSNNDGQGKGLRPSPYIRQIEAMFTPKSLYCQDPIVPMHPDWLLDALARGEFEEAQALAARRWLGKHGREKELDLLQAAETDLPAEEPLEYGELWDLMQLQDRSVGVTQLEQYARCPLAYYFRYGLQLSEREVLSVRALDDGNVLHALLEEIGPQLQQLIELEPAEIERRMDRLLDEHSEEFARYQAGSRYQYYWQKLKNTAGRAVSILQEQIRKGEFVPDAFEWKFGGGEGAAPALRIHLQDGREMKLMGRIDRVDILQEGEDRYVRILDYKSGRADWDLWDVYEGLKLQLPVYLDAYQTAHDVQPAGIFYFHLIPAVQKGTAEDTAEEEYKRILKGARLEGLMLNDPRIAELMDEDLQDAGTSLVIPARMKKDGTLWAGRQMADPEEFERLRRFAHAKAAQIGEQIVEGQVAPRPVLDGTELACTYCTYRNACRLDPLQHPEQVRRVDTHKDMDFWDAIP